MDLGKVYDRIDWDFLDIIMARKGFAHKWRGQIAGCLSSSHFPVIINKTSKGLFPSTRGLRQGDSLSSFLFTLLADSFNQSTEVEKKMIFSGFRISS